MKQELYDLAGMVIAAAKAAGADGCRASIGSRAVGGSGATADRNPENIKEASTKSLGIEVFAGGRYSPQQRTSDLRPDSLEDLHRRPPWP